MSTWAHFLVHRRNNFSLAVAGVWIQGNTLSIWNAGCPIIRPSSCISSMVTSYGQTLSRPWMSCSASLRSSHRLITRNISGNVQYVPPEPMGTHKQLYLVWLTGAFQNSYTDLVQFGSKQQSMFMFCSAENCNCTILMCGKWHHIVNMDRNHPVVVSEVLYSGLRFFLCLFYVINY
jgi:hypothetical protein